MTPKINKKFWFVIVLIAFILNLFIPDPIPFIDEIALGYATYVLGR